MLEKMKKDNKGFTLVELIVVIAILGILVAVLAPQYVKYVDKSRTAADASTLNEVAQATKIALSDEDITGPGKGFTITVTNGSAVAFADATKCSALATAVNNSLGGKPALKSSTYKTNGASCKVTYTNSTYSFGDWSAVKTTTP